MVQTAVCKARWSQLRVSSLITESNFIVIWIPAGGDESIFLKRPLFRVALKMEFSYCNGSEVFGDLSFSFVHRFKVNRTEPGRCQRGKPSIMNFLFTENKASRFEGAQRFNDE